MAHHPTPRTSAALAVLLLSLLATACGFRLQGDASLPAGLQSIYVATDDELTPFAVALRRTLIDSGATIAATAGEADVVLRVLRDHSGRRVLSVSARNTPQEYEIYYQLDYSVDRAGEQVVPKQSLGLTRNLTFDESLLLAKEHEEEILRDAMARDIVGLVMRRLESL